MNKTRAQKERSEVNKRKQQLKKQIAAIDSEIQKNQNEKTLLHKKFFKFQQSECILKRFCLCSIGVALAGVVAAVTCFFMGMSVEGELNGEVERIAQTEQHIEHKKEAVNRLYKDYQEGKITSNKLAEEIKNLDSTNYIKENYQTEGLKSADAKIDASDKVAGVAGIITASATGVGVVTFGSGVICDNRANAADNARFEIEGKIEVAQERKKGKEEELKDL